MADNSNLHTSKYSLKGVFVNSLWFGIFPKLPSLINVLLLPIITPYLSSWDYGIWGKISAYVSMGTAFCTMGLHIHLTNSYYEYGKKFYLVWGRLNYIIHILSLICASILLFALWFSLREMPIAQRIIISIISVFPALFYTNPLLASHLYPLRANPRPLVLRNFAASLSGIVLLYITVVIFKLGFIGFVVSSASTALVGYILFIKPLKKEKITIITHNRRKRVRECFIVALPLLPHTLGFALLSSSTRIVMDICGIQTNEIGLFTNGVSIGSYVVLITTAMASALVPQIQQYYRRGEMSSFRNLFYIDQLISFSCIFLFSLWMKECYTLLVRNEELFPAFKIAQIVCFANLIYPFYHFTSSIITIKKQTIHMLWLAFVPGVICVVLNFILLPLYGYKVSVTVSVFSYWTIFSLPLFVPYLKQITKEWIGSLWKIVLFAIIASITLVVVQFISTVDIVVKVVISLFYLVIACSALLFFNKRIRK